MTSTGATAPSALAGFAPDFTDATLPRLFARTAAVGAGEVALLGPGGRLTWQEYADRAHTLARRWAGVGVDRGEPVALMLSNSPDFHVVDTSLMCAGAIPFSVDPDDPAAHLAGLLDVARARVLITEPARLGHALTVAARCARRPAVVVTGDEEARADVVRLVDVAHAPPEEDPAPWERVEPEDDATLIFTSGTTGTPKAVRLSHRAVALSARNTDRIAPVGPGGHVVSYLPLTHIAERFMSHYLGLAFGLTITSVPDPDMLYDEIVRVRPTRFFGVPRVVEKLLDQVRCRLNADPALAGAAETARAYLTEEQSGRQLTDAERAGRQAAVERLAPVRQALGLDRTEYRGVATAPSSPAVLEQMAAVGLPFGNIWGLSEAIMCTMNPPDRLKLRTVGVFLDEVEGRVAADGEVLVRGVNLCSGYLHDPVRTAELVDVDGWLHTGDLGHIDEDGYLTVRGRKKEILVTATGKNVAPAAVETALRDASPLIEHALAVADGRRYVTAVLALDQERLAALVGGRGLEDAFAALSRRPETRAEIERAVTAANGTLPRAERVRGYVISDRPWLPGSDELTATMKLRREAILTSHADAIDELYASS